MNSLKDDIIYSFHALLTGYKVVCLNLLFLVKLAWPSLLLYLLIEPIYFAVSGTPLSSLNINKYNYSAVLPSVLYLIPIILLQLLYGMKASRVLYRLFITGRKSVNGYSAFIWNEKEFHFLVTNIKYALIIALVGVVSFGLPWLIGAASIIIGGVTDLYTARQANSLGALMTLLALIFSFCITATYAIKGVMVLPSKALGIDMKILESRISMHHSARRLLLTIGLSCMPVFCLALVKSRLWSSEWSEISLIVANASIYLISFLTGIVATYQISRAYKSLRAESIIT